MSGPLLDSGVHELWLREAAGGCPPDPVSVARLQYGLLVPWFWEYAFLPVLRSWVNNVYGRVVFEGLGVPDEKMLVCRELSRGAGKSVSASFARLYVAEYVLPFIPNIRQANRRMIIFSREERHLHNEVMQAVVEMVHEFSPWLKLHDWRERLERGDNIEEAMLKARKWTNSRMDLTNGVSIRGHTIKQNIRGAHVYWVDIDDLLSEENAPFSGEIMDKLLGMALPAIEPTGMMIVYGTPQQPGDLYDMIKENPRWDYMSLPAQDIDGQPFPPVSYAEKNQELIDAGELELKSPRDINCLWAHRLTMKQLDAERGSARLDELKFQREYLLKRVTDSTALVDMESLLAAKDPSISYVFDGDPKQYYYGGHDPSSLKQDDAAFCIGVVDESGKRVVQYLEALRADALYKRSDVSGEMKVVETLNELSTRFNWPKWTVEGNGFQGVLKGLMRSIKPGIVMDEFSLTSNKHTENGWKGIQTAFRSRKIRLPYATEEDQRLTEELVHQLQGIQIVDGKIIEDPRRKNDLVSALFLFLKASETVERGSMVSMADLLNPYSDSSNPHRRPDPETSPKAYAATQPGMRALHGRIQRANAMRSQRLKRY